MKEITYKGCLIGKPDNISLNCIKRYVDNVAVHNEFQENPSKSDGEQNDSQSLPLCECGRPLVNKLVCTDKNCQHTSW